MFWQQHPGRKGMARRLLLVVATFAVVCSVVGVASPAEAYPAGEEFPTLMLGSRGADVVALHYVLTARGYVCSGDVFNSTTYSQVRAFQAAYGLYPVDGIVGPTTWGRLIIVVYPWNSGSQVKALQSLLNAKRFTALQVDGVYGTQSQLAVRTFQAHMGITVDGIVGLYTWRNLLWHYQRVQTVSGNQCVVPSGHSLDRVWAVASVSAWFSEAARVFKQDWGRKVSFQDFSLEYPTHGGPMSPHDTHQRGMDGDVQLVHKTASRQCQDIINRWDGDYDAQGTIGLALDLVEATGAFNPDWIKKMLFNDVDVRDAVNSMYPDTMSPYEHHDDHIHVRWCVVYYPPNTTPSHYPPNDWGWCDC
jgi:peptidoglycan hydrolase-like protein with peptidoglycan-binding domain